MPRPVRSVARTAFAAAQLLLLGAALLGLRSLLEIVLGGVVLGLLLLNPALFRRPARRSRYPAGARLPARGGEREAVRHRSPA